VLVGQKRIPEALKRLDDMVAQYPQRAYAVNLKGEVLLAQKRAAEAIAAFRTAIEREPGNALIYRNLALAQMSNRDNDAAIATLQAAIGKVTHPEPLEIALGGFYERNGKTDEAMQVYENALRRNPQADFIANNLAMLLVDTKQDPASLERAKQLSARFSTSSNAQLLDTYGWVLYKKGEATAAIAALQSASAKAPDLPVLWYHLGMAQALAGQPDAARGSLARSLKSGESFSGIDQAKATLDKLAKQAPGDTAPKS
jgi:tetratricopeptide (TPR) repeat protein